MKIFVYLLGFLWVAAGAAAILYTVDYKAYVKGLLEKLDRRILALIPAYNEATRLAPVVTGTLAHLPVLVVDDGSTDGGPNRLADLPISLVAHERNRGKGFSVRRGMLAATGQFRLFSDADLSTPIEEIERLQSLGVSVSPEKSR